VTLASRFSRRAFLAAAAAVLAAPSEAAEARIAALIGEFRALPSLSERIERISRALIGSRYRAETLIGGAKKPEIFVTRDDVFDCVTYCEVVLAAANARGADEFEPLLRRIRYRGGVVGWRERNHDFADWCAQNVANGLCRPVEFDGAVEVKKVMTWPAQLGRRTYTIKAVPRAVLLKERAQVMSGDIVGFVSARPVLDYFHCGFAMTGERGALKLRHAAQSKKRVLEEPLENFLAANRVKWVTLLRPQQRTLA